MRIDQFIDSLNLLYRPALNGGQMDIYAGFLSRYTENQLEELWVNTMEAHMYTSPPTIGKLGDYAKGITQMQVVNSENQKKLEFANLTDEEIFSTRLGGFGLKQGFADSYRIWCRRKGIPPQTDEMLLWFQRSQHRADTAISELKKSDDLDHFSKTLVNFRNTMNEKNGNLRKEFAHLIKDAIAIPADLSATTGV